MAWILYSISSLTVKYSLRFGINIMESQELWRSECAVNAPNSETKESYVDFLASRLYFLEQFLFKEYHT